MDRFDVIDVCTRMAWHTDQREWSELAEVFADKVTLDYSSLNGGEPATLAPDQIVAAWQGALGAYTTTHHLLGNHLVTLDGDTAVCTASFQATHREADDTLCSIMTRRVILTRSTSRVAWSLRAIRGAGCYEETIRPQVKPPEPGAQVRIPQGAHSISQAR